jgi:hypothetical protein
MSEIMKKILVKSKNKQHTIRLNTSHPDGDAYDGVVLGISRSIIVFQDTSDFTIEGVSILPRKWLTKIRDSKFEKCYDKVLRLHGEMENLNKKEWVNELTSIKSAIKKIYTKGIWPSIEVFDGKRKTAMFLGPITEIKSKKFTVYAYDAIGKWEQEYDINYSEVFCIQLFNQYTERFNKFMKEKNI